MQLPERSHGLVVFRPVVRPLEALPPQRLLGLGQIADHVLPLVPLTPLDHGAATESLPNGRPEPFAAVEDHQHALRDVEAPLKQRPQERRQHLRVLRVGFDEAQEAFLSRHRDAERNHHRRLGERLAVQDDGHHVLIGEVSLVELVQFRGTGLDERPGHGRPRQPDRPGNRLRRGRVVAARNPI